MQSDAIKWSGMNNWKRIDMIRYDVMLFYSFIHSTYTQLLAVLILIQTLFNKEEEDFE